MVQPEPPEPVRVQRPAALEVPDPAPEPEAQSEPAAAPEPEPELEARPEPEVDPVEALMPIRPAAEPEAPSTEPAAGPAKIPDDWAVEEPMSLEELDAYHRELDKARVMIGAGSVAAVTAILLFVGTGVEASKPKCNFDLDDCDDPPRKKVAAGLGITGGVLTVAGATLIGVGVHRIRRIKAQPHFNSQSAGITIRGRF